MNLSLGWRIPIPVAPAQAEEKPKPKPSQPNLQAFCEKTIVWEPGEML